MTRATIKDAFRKLNRVDKAKVFSELAAIFETVVANEQPRRTSQSSKKRIGRSRPTRRDAGRQ